MPLWKGALELGGGVFEEEPQVVVYGVAVCSVTHIQRKRRILLEGVLVRWGCCVGLVAQVGQMARPVGD